MPYLEEQLSEEELEEVNELVNGNNPELNYARMAYNQISYEYGHLKTNNFLDMFNILTEDVRCLIPENYPLMLKEFQIKFMRETRLLIDPNTKFMTPKDLWSVHEDLKDEEAQQRHDQRTRTIEEIDQYEISRMDIN